MTNNSNTTLNKTEIFVNEIVFYSKEEISLFGFVHNGGQFHETEYVIARNHLQVLLSSNKKSGVEILWRMEELFIYPHEAPVALNLVDLFGTTQVFEAKEIVLDAPAIDLDEAAKAEAENGCEVLFVNAVIPLVPGIKFFS